MGLLIVINIENLIQFTHFYPSLFIFVRIQDFKHPTLRFHLNPTRNEFPRRAIPDQLSFLKIHKYV